MPTYSLNEPLLKPLSTASAAFSQPARTAASSTSLYQPLMPPVPGTSNSTVFSRNEPSVRAAAPVDPARFAAPPPLQSPGNNLTNPGYTEQGLEHVQNRLLEDPYAQQMQGQFQQTQTPTSGENYLNKNLGTLDGPGQGDQYWNQVQGQFNQPFSGEQFTREATQALSPNGASSAFYNAQNPSQYTNYTGGNNAQGQYQANASSGPLAGQQFYDQADYNTTGRYTDQNRAGAQYEQTQGAFGDLPIANFDPFYDRARQLGVQAYNQDAAGRGVYGSSETLSGVGNVITDIEAQRANRSFDAEMQRAAELRARQQLLGEQARQGDLSSLGAFGANLEGVSTFGNLAKTAGEQTLGQQTMLGNQARQADVTGLETMEQERRGMETLGSLANDADRNETDRFAARTSAMNAADRLGLDRLNSGADIAFRGDENAREDYRVGAGVANDAANLSLDRTRLGADIANSGSRNDLARLDSFMNATSIAEDDRQGRQHAALDAMNEYSDDVQGALSSGLSAFFSGEYQSFEDAFNAVIAPVLQEAQYDEKQKAEVMQVFNELVKAAGAQAK